LEPARARFRLFNSVTAFLKNASQRTPLVLVLDDLHWADRSSLLLLQFLSQQLGDARLLTIGTFRDVEVRPQHALSETLAQLAREPVFRRQSLRGLSLEDIGQFIEITAGIWPTQRLIDAVYTRTEGNPFFTAEVVRLLSERGELTDSNGLESAATAIPAGVLEAIGRRLNRLSSQCHQTLTTAAVIGREFEFQLLSLLSTGTSEEQLLDVIDEALEAHLIEEIPHRQERYQFCHALIQETLTQQLSRSRRVRLHARIAQALEVLYGQSADAHAEELAYHFGEAQPLLGSEKFVKYSLLAGGQALAAYAWVEALAYFQRGLEAKGLPLQGTEPARDEEEAELLFGLGLARSATAELHGFQEAIDMLARALDYYIRVGDSEKVYQVGICPVSIRPGLTRGSELMSKAMANTDASSVEWGRLLARYGFLLSWEKGDLVSAREAYSEALAIAQENGSLALESETLSCLIDMDSYGYAFDFDGLTARISRVNELCRVIDDPRVESIANRGAALSLLTAGKMAEANKHAAICLRSAERLRDNNELGGALWANESLAYMEGDWSAARSFNDREQEFIPSSVLTLCSRTLTEYLTGNTDQCDHYLQRLLNVYRLSAAGLPESSYFALSMSQLAYLTGITEYLGYAEKAAQSTLSVPHGIAAFDIAAKSALALTAVCRSDQRAAQEWYQQLIMLDFRPKATPIVCLDHLLGLLAQTIGNDQEATTHYDQATSFLQRGGMRPELAWTCYDYGKALLQQSDPGDHARALSLLEESLALSRELGMQPLMERVARLQEQIQSQPARPPAYPDGLTQREVEVLRLIAVGKSDREIAQELFISVRTVNNHVRGILNKTGLSNRVEAAAYAVRLGLV
jgi:DNA-binding CsgD family transcriptional regulator